MKKIVAIASGKGGVGKSTIAANLAACFANCELAPGGRPLNVALIDLDFYGPSIPTIMGGGELGVDEVTGKMIPALKYGVKYTSIGFLLPNSDDPVIWRGPMLGKAVSELFDKFNFGEVDICIVDLPPGTGDAQISLTQNMPVDGVLMVTTPQEVALSDVRRAINMFARMNVPVLGIIENMAGFVTPTGECYDIFGTGGGESLSKRYGIPLLCSVPIEMAVRMGGDSGRPSVLERNSQFSSIMQNLAESVWVKLEQLESTPQLKVEN